MSWSPAKIKIQAKYFIIYKDFIAKANNIFILLQLGKAPKIKYI